jgi:hypothetical protein
MSFIFVYIDLEAAIFLGDPQGLEKFLAVLVA